MHAIDDLLEREGLSIRMLHEHQCIEESFIQAQILLFGSDVCHVRNYTEKESAFELAEKFGRSADILAPVPAFLKNVPELRFAWAEGQLARIEIEGCLSGDASAIPATLARDPVCLKAWNQGVENRADIDYENKVIEWENAADQEQFEMACRTNRGLTP